MMKRNLMSLVVTAGVLLALNSCGKEGPVGPAGKDGKNGSVIDPADQAAYDAADADAGGLYYNKFWVNPTDGTTPANTDTVITKNQDFFRCKACHGWDLLGTNGQYISRGPTATRPNVAPNNLNYFAQTHNIKEVFDAVKHSGGRQQISNVKSLNSNMPDYGLLMSDARIWDIVKYLKEARINSDQFYDLKTSGSYPTGSYTLQNLGKGGDAAAGDAYWASKCASCHGATGLNNIPGTTTIGNVARNKAAEMNHLVKFGLPGNSMFTGSFVHNITATEMLDLDKALSDTTNFPD